MSHPAHTVSAAIYTMAEKDMAAAKIADTDTDGVAAAMANAEIAVANQLTREGMELTEARELASRAVNLPGRTSPASDALAEEAERNRHAPTPGAAQAARTAPSAPGTILGAATSEATASLIEDAPAPGMAPTLPGVGAPAAVHAPAPIAFAAAPVMTSTPAHVGRTDYEVVMVPVSKAFPGIAPGTPGFNFDVPVITWEKAHPGVPPIDPHFAYDLTQLMTVLYAVVERVSLNLVGPHGAGKTQIVNQVAARLGFPVTLLPMDGQITRREIFGQKELRVTTHGPESYYEPGLLVRGLMEPGFVLFDEVDRGVSDLQYACHSVYLQESLKVLEDGGRIVPFGEWNRVFGTSNTKGRGSMDGMYQASEEMSEATRDRWSLWLEVPYQSVDDDESVVKAKMDGLVGRHARIIAEIANNIREAYSTLGKMAQTCSLRQQLETARYARFLARGETDDDRIDKCLRLAVETVMAGRASDADKGLIQTFITTHMPHVYVGAPLY